MADRLPARPLAKWINRQIVRLEQDETLGTGPIQHLSRRMEVDEKVVRRWRDRLGGTDKPTETQPRTTVEDALHRYGAMMFDVFPDLADDEPADDEPKRRGGWTRPDKRGSRYTETQLRAMHLVHVRKGTSLNALGKQTYAAVGYKNPGSAAMAISREWRRLGLPVPDRIDQVRKSCTIHGKAPKHGSRRGYNRHRRLAGTYALTPYRATCKAVRQSPPRKGEPCQNSTMEGSDYCAQHDPERQAEIRDHLAAMRAKSPAHSKPMLPIEPLADWLQRRHSELGTWDAVADSCGTGSVHRWATRKVARIGRDTVERILELDGTATLGELYAAGSSGQPGLTTPEGAAPVSDGKPRPAREPRTAAGISA